MPDLTPREPYRPLTWPDAVLEIQDLLYNTPHPAYIVGGAVRDAMLGRAVKDLDLATPGDSVGIARAIANHFKGDFYVMDADRGVARALIETMYGPLNIDVAAFRAGDSLEADLRDRDFTVNAIAADLKGDLTKIIDPLNGEADIKAKVIRRCGPHAIASDAIRGLRAVRQSVQLTYRMEPETLRDVRDNAARLGESSPERVRDEFFKMLSLERPSAALRVADRLGLLRQILPALNSLDGRTVPPHDTPALDYTMTTVERLNDLRFAISPMRDRVSATSFELGVAVIQLDRYRDPLQTHLADPWPNDRPHRALLFLAALVHATDNVETVADDLRLSNGEKKRLLDIVVHQDDLPDADVLSQHRYWYTLGAAGVDVAMLTLAKHLGARSHRLEQDPWVALIEQVRVAFEVYFEKYETIVQPPVLLTGNQLVDELGLKPGPIIGQLLTAIREAQVTGDVLSEADALRYARNALGDDAR